MVSSLLIELPERRRRAWPEAESRLTAPRYGT
jgi:hypothetical protein